MKSKLFKTNKTYFIADIAANHDGNLNRAKKLIKLCAKAGANAAKLLVIKGLSLQVKLLTKKNGNIVFLILIKKQASIQVGA